MRDWQAYVRARLDVGDLTPGRQARIVRELAAQLEDFYRDAVARGAGDADADAHARAQITDWRRMAADVRVADRAHLRPATDRLVDAVEARPAAGRGGLLMFAHGIRDARYAIRHLAKSPGFTLVAVLTIALGIGATTAIFSVVNGVLLRPLPFPDAAGLVRVNEFVPQYGQFSVAPANFFDWRRQNTVFERIAAYSTSSATLATAAGPERVQGAVVSWDLFELLRVAPARGSSFAADHDKPGAEPVIVISHRMWQSRFGGDPAIVGRSVTINRAPTTVIGVMPADFYYPTRTAEFWRPIALNPVNPPRGAHYLGVVARLKPGVTAERAGAEMKTIAERLAVEYPAANANESATVVRLQDQIVGAIRPALLTLLAAVGVVVLIACANVANLLLVRASVRQKEIAVRAALGADARRLVVQMLAESLVLATVGGAIGVLLGYLTIAPIQQLGAGSIPRVADITVDGRVLAFAAGASILTGLLFGLAPAWHASRGGVVEALKQGGRSSSASGSRWLRNGLLVAEVALSIVLLTGASLLLRSFGKLVNVDPGFKPDNVLAFQVSLPQPAYAGPKVLGFYDALVDRLGGQAGVQSVGLVQTLPMRGDYVLSFAVRGQAPAKPGEEPSANHRVVSPRYFDALGIPVTRGRAFSAQDTATSQSVAIVDEAFVKKYLSAGGDPLSQGIDIGNGTDGFMEIVGVVGNVHYSGLDATASPTMYVPLTQDAFSTMWVLARSKGDPAPLAAAARQAVREIDPALPAYSINPLATIVSESVATQRFSMLLLTLFAVVALFLAAVGLYGVVAYSVSQRTREIGLRMAIGARPGDVMRMVVGGGMKLALVGVVVGVGAAIAMARLIETLLFDVKPSDPVSYASTSVLLLAVAGLACYVPARRATRVDPLVALQGE